MSLVSEDWWFLPRGYFQTRRWGVWTSHQVWRQNLGQGQPCSPNKRENLGSSNSVTTRRKSWGKVPNLGSYLKFRGQNFLRIVIYIFGGKIWGSNKNFRGKIWGQAPRPPGNMEVPPGFPLQLSRRICVKSRSYLKIRAWISGKIFGWSHICCRC